IGQGRGGNALARADATDQPDDGEPTVPPGAARASISGSLARMPGHSLRGMGQDGSHDHDADAAPRVRGDRLQRTLRGALKRGDMGSWGWSRPMSRVRGWSQREAWGAWSCRTMRRDLSRLRKAVYDGWRVPRSVTSRALPPLRIVLARTRREGEETGHR